MIIALGLILTFLLLLVGGEKGLQSCVSILLNLGMLILYIIAIAQGAPFWITTIVVSLLFVAITLIYQAGWNSKTMVSALASCLMALLLCGLVLLFVRMTRMAGLSEIEVSMDMGNAVSANVNMDMSDVTMAVILLGTLGAVMDTAMSIATAVYEVFRNNPEISLKRLIVAGTHVGQDILGTTANTLCFAGLGEALTLAVYYAIHGFRFAQLLNSESVFLEFSSILIANVGCVLIIPLTTILIGVYLNWQRERELLRLEAQQAELEKKGANQDD